MFGGVTPKDNLYQNYNSGQNNIESAHAAIYGIYPWNFKAPDGWHQKLMELVDN